MENTATNIVINIIQGVGVFALFIIVFCVFIAISAFGWTLFKSISETTKEDEEKIPIHIQIIIGAVTSGVIIFCLWFLGSFVS